jgi:hypothetical protein
VTATLLLYLLAATPAIDQAIDVPAAEPRVALWAQPLGFTAAPLGVSLAGAGTYVAVPLGATLLFEPTEINVEATFYTFKDGQRASFEGGYLAVGPIFHTGDRPLNGFFIEPKLILDLYHDDIRGQLGLDLLPGIDFGWQHTFGRFYLALALGISGGWALSDGDGIEGPGLNASLPTKSRAVVGFNLNLLRVGFSF